VTLVQKIEISEDSAEDVECLLTR